VAKKELYKNPVFAWLLLRINTLPVKRGTIDRAAMDMAESRIAEGMVMVMFPEGTRSKTMDFLPPRPGVGMLAQRATCPIVPAYISGSNRLMDCFLGRRRLTVMYGKPIESSWVMDMPANKDSWQVIASEVMARIGSLRQSALPAQE